MGALRLAVLSVTVLASAMLAAEGGADETSLIEAACFRRTFIREHPHEDAIALESESSGGALAARAVYTLSGRVWAHSTTGDRRLEGVAPSDFSQPEILRRALARTSFLPSRSPVGPMPMETMAQSLEAVGIPAMLDKAAGATPSLRFYWNDATYRYVPRGGVHREPTRRDPLAGMEVLALPRGSLIDCLLFCTAYRRRFPEEQAVLVTAAGVRPGEAFTTGAAYTRGAFLGIHTLQGENQEIHGAGVEASMIANPSVLVKLCARLNPPARSSHASPLPDAEILYDLAVANARLAEAGIESDVNATVKREGGAVDPSMARLVCNFDGVQYGYSPSRGGYWKGSSPARPSTSLLDGLLFRAAYLARNPGERVIILVHAPSSTLLERKVVAETYYSRGGAVWRQSALCDDFEVTGLTAQALGQPGLLSGTSAPEFARRVASRRASHTDPAAARPGDPGLGEIVRALRASGIIAAITSFRPQSEAGEMQAFTEERVGFTWDNRRYTYVDNACFAYGPSSGPQP